jgi:CRP/FNR family transcriptional regulator
MGDNRTDRPPRLEPPSFAPCVVEEVLAGSRELGRAFMQAPHRTASRGSLIVSLDDPAPPVFLINRGMAYRSCTLPDGRRAILDVLVPRDIGGLDFAVMGLSNQEVTAASEISYRPLSATAIRELMADRAVALRVMGLLGEARWRMDRHAAAVCRLQAHERIAAFLLGFYDRLRQHQLISRPTFNLPLTQEQIADHLGMTMVHVNRVLRRLRDERLVMLDRQVVIIMDLDRLRELAHGLPLLAMPTAEFNLAEEGEG